VFHEMIAPLAVMPDAATAVIIGAVVSTTAVTVTVADALMLGFDVHAAFTAYVPGAAGAVKNPPVPIAPPVADQEIVSVAPVTNAVNCPVSPEVMLAFAGLIETTVPTVVSETITPATVDIESTREALTIKG